MNNNINSIANIKNRMNNDKVFVYLAYYCAIFTGGMALLCFSGAHIPMGILFVILTYLQVKYIKKSNRNEKIYMNYISEILVHKETNINKIANELGVNYDEALRMITLIISKNYIVGYKINKKDGILVLDTTKNYGSTIDIECPNCGGSRYDIVNGIMYCKYCGSIIK